MRACTRHGNCFAAAVLLCCVGWARAIQLVCCVAGRCRCCAGAYFDGVTCVACMPGAYCPTGVSATPCPAGTYNALYGATDASFCLPWSGTVCNGGQYVLSPPNATRDVVCSACRTACPAGQYRVGVCSGATTADVVQCADCRSCPDGSFRWPPCDGTQASDSVCSTCSVGGCVAGMYRGACGSDRDGACVNCSACAPGYYNRGCAGGTDGVCARCSSCQTGTVQYRPCGGVLDVGCNGGACNATRSCGSLFCSYGVLLKPGCNMTWADYTGGQNFLCLTSSTQGTCQLCPAGYYASGAYCLECPYGQSCDAGGAVQCRGQCVPRTYPTCDASTGYVQCWPCSINATTLAQQHMVLTRGGVIGAPQLCGAYFDCAVGYYLASTQDQSQLTCLPCLASEASAQAWAFWSHGMTFGDAFSCLYAPATAPVSSNALGYYGSLQTSCPPGGHTSQPGAALTAADCLLCPNAPLNGQFADGLFDCSVECDAGYARLGEACVPLDAGLISCAADGFAAGAGGCSASPLPWNAPGSQGAGGWTSAVSPNAAAPLAALDVGAGVGAADTGLFASYYADTGPVNMCTGIVGTAPNVGYVQDKPLFASTCLDLESHRFYMVVAGGSFVYAFLERAFGFNNRYILWQIDTRTLVTGQYGKVWQAWRLPGKVCSAAWTSGSGAEYLHLALCDAPFLIFVAAHDLYTQGVPPDVTLVTVSRSASYAIGRRYGRLIGQDREGQADGMRDVALFGTTLSVANSSDPRRIFVADAENCRLVEVVIDTPGSFLTRATSIGTPSCFSGPAPLPSPRLLTSVLGGLWLLFLTDNGLMQMDALTRTVQTALPAEALPLAPLWMGAAESGSALVLANGSHTAWVRRLQTRCPPHQMSARGAGCAECPRTSYALLGGCVQCSAPLCGPNETLVPCGGSSDAYCRPCSGRAAYPFVYGANCSLVPVAPCPGGYYGTSTCAVCPVWYGPTAYASVPQYGVCACFPTGVMVNGTWCRVASPFADGHGSDWLAAANPWVQGLSCTYSECPYHGCYLQQAFPRVCAECPPGLYGWNGLWCEVCPGFRVPTPARDSCACAPPAGMDASGGCVCPAGYTAGGAVGCSPCAEGAYQPLGTALWDDYPAQPQVPCLPCPAGNASSDDRTRCVACPAGAYREEAMGGCVSCADPRAYARDPARGDSCTACSAACGYGQRWGACPVDASLFVCEPCAPLQSPGQRYVTGRDNRACWTECAAGHYEAGSLCLPCTVAECPPGAVYAPCTRYADYRCDQACVNESKPTQNSVWAEGCSWACAPGFTLRTRRVLSWMEYACESQGSVPWTGWW